MSSSARAREPATGNASGPILRCIEASATATQDEYGIIVDPFAERTYDHTSAIKRSRTRPWIGFLHEPAGRPRWYPEDRSPERLIRNDRFREDLHHCIGLVTFSSPIRDWWKARVDVTVVLARTPPGLVERRFSMAAFQSNPDPRLLQVEVWLHRLGALRDVPVRSLKPTFVIRTDRQYSDLADRERRALGGRNNTQLSTTTSVEHVSLTLDETEMALTCNIVFAELFAAGAAPVVLYCLDRATPLLVNPLPAVRELLGDDYPLFFATRREAARKADDLNLVAAAHRYLLDRANATVRTADLRSSIAALFEPVALKPARITSDQVRLAALDVAEPDR